MLSIRTAHQYDRNGNRQIVAKGSGRQRTVNVDQAKSIDANEGAAMGTLLDVLLDDRQKAMLRHPSGGRRVRETLMSQHTAPVTTRVWEVNV